MNLCLQNSETDDFFVVCRSYLELIMAFKTSLAAKRDEISTAKRRYEVGLEKLAFATESVNAMQVISLHHICRNSSQCIYTL